MLHNSMCSNTIQWPGYDPLMVVWLWVTCKLRTALILIYVLGFISSFDCFLTWANMDNIYPQILVVNFSSLHEQLAILIATFFKMHTHVSVCCCECTQLATLIATFFWYIHMCVFSVKAQNYEYSLQLSFTYIHMCMCFCVNAHNWQCSLQLFLRYIHICMCFCVKAHN
jgi:hypothetical protein